MTLHIAVKDTTEDDIPDLDIVEQRDLQFDVDKTYYLAGPMSGYPGFNYAEFDNACKILRKEGLHIASPHEIDHEETEETRGQKDYEEYMTAGLELLRKCEGIILLAGWARSTGACRELSQAIEQGIPVYFFHEPTTWKDNAELVCMNRKIPT